MLTDIVDLRKDILITLDTIAQTQAKMFHTFQHMQTESFVRDLLRYQIPNELDRLKYIKLYDTYLIQYKNDNYPQSS